MQALIGYALVAGFTVAMPAPVRETLALFGITAPPPPPPPKPITPPRVASHKPQGAAAPPNLRAKATEIVAVPPIVPVTLPPPVITAKIAGQGNAPAAGAADIRGPGTGAGGEGDGTGSGGAGDGEGDGDDTPPKLRRGRIKSGDYPDAANEPYSPLGTTRTVGIRYTVETDGRATHCVVTHRSGNAALDATTCRLVEERFIFTPSRDSDGNAVESLVVENHTWDVHQGPDAPKHR